MLVQLLRAIADELFGEEKSPASKGELGEKQLNEKLAKALEADWYFLSHNVILTWGDSTTQIDHVLLSPFGAFCIETKNYNGSIYGKAQDQTWRQKIGYETHKFQNPLRQNFLHTKVLSDTLEIPHEHVHSLIVFVGSAKLRTEMPENVVTIDHVAEAVRGKRTVLYTHADLERLRTKLKQASLEDSPETRELHVSGIQERVAEKERLREERRAVRDQKQSAQAVSQATAPTCPRCGAPMVLRTAKRGENRGHSFWGCSAYPKCRAIVSVGEALPLG